MVCPILYSDELGLATPATRFRRLETVVARGLVDRRPRMGDLTILANELFDVFWSVCHRTIVDCLTNKAVGSTGGHS